MMRVVEVSERSDIERQLASWRALSDDRTVGDMFESYEWLAPWLDAYWDGGRLAFLFAYEDDHLAGFLPLLRDDNGAFGCRGVWTTAINPHVRRQELLARGAPDRPLAAMLEHVRTHHGGAARFRHLPADSALATTLPEVAIEFGLRTVSWPETSSPVADLSDGWDAYAASRPRQMRREMARKSRKLEKAGGWRFRTLSAPGEWRQAFEAVADVERRSWKQAGKTSIANEPGAAAFYERLMQLNAERGRLIVHLLEYEQRPVAHVLGIADRDHFLAIKTAYDADERGSAPGAVLMWHTLEDAAARGFHAFDFLGDSAPWKEALGSYERRYVTLCLFPILRVRCELCRAQETTLKPAGRRLGVHRLIRRLRGQIN